MPFQKKLVSLISKAIIKSEVVVLVSLIYWLGLEPFKKYKVTVKNEQKGQNMISPSSFEILMS